MPTGKRLALFSSKYEHFIVLDNFNVDIDNISMTVFCDMYHLKSLTKKPTCYKNPVDLSWISLILRNNPKYFQCSWDKQLHRFSQDDSYSHEN